MYGILQALRNNVQELPHEAYHECDDTLRYTTLKAGLMSLYIVVAGIMSIHVAAVKLTEPLVTRVYIIWLGRNITRMYYGTCQVSYRIFKQDNLSLTHCTLHRCTSTRD